MNISLSSFLLATGASLVLSTAAAQQPHTPIDRFARHLSTAQTNEGDLVGIFLHERVSSATLEAIRLGEEPRVVLFIHGGSVSSVPNFDLPFKDYSWMETFAEAGFDTFSMDQTGYGFSPRPLMDNPCNVRSADQHLLIPQVLAESCETGHAYPLTTLQSDVDEIDTVVEYLRDLRGVDRVHLIGWSAGGRRSAAYAATYPEKVARIVLVAPSVPNPDAVDQDVTAPMRLQSRTALMRDRWEDQIVCENQVDPEIRDVIWQTIMAFDSLGSAWGAPEGVMRVRMAKGLEWDTSFPEKIAADTLILVGRQDGLLESGRRLYSDLMMPQRKVLVEMECATHMAAWERSQYRFMQEASRQWLSSGQLHDQTTGRFRSPANSMEIRD